MKRRGFITRIMAALGAALGIGGSLGLHPRQSGVSDLPVPAPPTDPFDGRCYACLDTGRVYDRTGGALPCHVCSAPLCRRCGGTGEIIIETPGHKGVTSLVEGTGLPVPYGALYESRPCPRYSPGLGMVLGGPSGCSAR